VNHDRTFANNRLRGLADQLERGELDYEFATAEVPIAAIREAAVRYIRQTADSLERLDGVTLG
jgi:hypothetical protein